MSESLAQGKTRVKCVLGEVSRKQKSKPSDEPELGRTSSSSGVRLIRAALPARVEVIRHEETRREASLYSDVVPTV